MRGFLHVENKPGQSYSRYFQAGRAEMLPAHWAPVGMGKGEDGEKESRSLHLQGSLNSGNLRLPSQSCLWLGLKMVAQGRHSAGRRQGMHPTAAIPLVSAGRINQGWHPLPCHGLKMSVKRLCSLVSFGIS